MRILHVVTLISPDGAYGGPVRVATNLAREQGNQGHETLVVGGWEGNSEAPRKFDGVDVRLFRARRLVPGAGFAGLGAPGLTRWVLQNRKEWDVVHIHAARDLVTMPLARFLVEVWHRPALFLQMHGMVDESARPEASVFDRIFTRAAVSGVEGIFVLTDAEEASLTALFGSSSNLIPVVNGVPHSVSGHSKTSKEVLFMARLHKRKRPDLFAQAAVSLAVEYSDWSFTLIGPDEGEGPTVDRILTHSRQPGVTRQPAIPPTGTLDRMSQAAIFVLPSIDEPFPMAVVEALSIGLPAIVTTSCGLAELITKYECGLVVEPSLSALVDGMRSLMESPTERSRLGDNALRAVEQELSIGTVAAAMTESYRKVPARKR